MKNAKSLVQNLNLGRHVYVPTMLTIKLRENRWIRTFTKDIKVM